MADASGECVPVDAVPILPWWAISPRGASTPDLVVVGAGRPARRRCRRRGCTDRGSPRVRSRRGGSPARGLQEVDEGRAGCELRACPTAALRGRSPRATRPTDASRLEYLIRPRRVRIVKTDGLAAGKGVDRYASRSPARVTRCVLPSPGRRASRAPAARGVDRGGPAPGPRCRCSCCATANGAVPGDRALAQDHKRAFDGDTGPNTGGMGAYSPVPASIASADLVDEMMDRKAIPPDPRRASRRRGARVPRARCSAGFMLDPVKGPQVLEYNVRFGDPECQVVIPRLASDLYVHCRESAEGRIETDVIARPASTIASALVLRIRAATRPRPTGRAT